VNIYALSGIRTHSPAMKRLQTYTWYRTATVISKAKLYFHYSLIPRYSKVIPYRLGVAQRVGRGIALLFHDRDTRRGWVVSSTPRPHFSTGKDPVPILQEAGWAPGPVWTCGKSRPHRDSIPDRAVHSQSLYRLSYPAHTFSSYLPLFSPWSTVAYCMCPHLWHCQLIAHTLSVCVALDVRNEQPLFP